MVCILQNRPGDILSFASKIVYAGKTSLVAYVEVKKPNTDDAFVSGFITFIHVNEQTKPVAHHLTITPKTNEDLDLFRQALELKSK